MTDVARPISSPSNFVYASSKRSNLAQPPPAPQRRKPTVSRTRGASLAFRPLARTLRYPCLDICTTTMPRSIQQQQRQPKPPLAQKKEITKTIPPAFLRKPADQHPKYSMALNFISKKLGGGRGGLKGPLISFSGPPSREMELQRRGRFSFFQNDGARPPRDIGLFFPPEEPVIPLSVQPQHLNQADDDFYGDDGYDPIERTMEGSTTLPYLDHQEEENNNNNNNNNKKEELAVEALVLLTQESFILDDNNNKYDVATSRSASSRSLEPLNLRPALEASAYLDGNYPPESAPSSDYPSFSGCSSASSSKSKDWDMAKSQREEEEECNNEERAIRDLARRDAAFWAEWASSQKPL